MRRERRGMSKNPSGRGRLVEVKGMTGGGQGRERRGSETLAGVEPRGGFRRWVPR